MNIQYKFNAENSFNDDRCMSKKNHFEKISVKIKHEKQLSNPLNSSNYSSIKTHKYK